ncbi:MAG: DUF4350 domain-containing protein, partial [Bacteroidota bacterium]
MRNALPYLLLVLVFLGYILLEVLGPQPENWAPIYEKDSRDPFGSFLVYDRLEDLFPGQSITVTEKSPEAELKEFKKDKSNYIIIQESFESNQSEAKSLLKFAERGNTVFIAATVFMGALADSLEIDNLNAFEDKMDMKDPSRDAYLHFEVDQDSAARRYPLLSNVYYNDFGRSGMSGNYEVLSS